MLIEQIIEFELRGLGPLDDYVLLQLVKFMRGNSLGGLLFTATILRKAMCLTSRCVDKSLTIKILHHNTRF